MVSTCKLINHKDRIDCRARKIVISAIIVRSLSFYMFRLYFGNVASVASISNLGLGSNCVDQALRFAFNG